MIINHEEMVDLCIYISEITSRPVNLSNCYDLCCDCTMHGRECTPLSIPVGSRIDAHGAPIGNDPSEFSTLNRQDDLSLYGEKRKA